jgi:metal-responsive CopG/Arc/MetJ family transcriptional regulator
MRRTIVDLEERQIEALDKLAGRLRRSRAAIVRDAVAAYLDRNPPGSLDAAFGLWGRGVDGLVYQESLRREW